MPPPARAGLLLVAGLAYAAIVQAQQGAVGGIGFARQAAAVGVAEHGGRRAMRDVAGHTYHLIARAGLSQRDAHRNPACIGKAGRLRVQVIAVRKGHIHPVGKAAGERQDRCCSSQRWRRFHGRRCGRRRTDRCAAAPLLAVVIFSAFIHLGHLNCNPVHLGLDQAVVGRAMRIVAGGAGKFGVGDGRRGAGVRPRCPRPAAGRRRRSYHAARLPGSRDNTENHLPGAGCHPACWQPRDFHPSPCHRAETR